jgi:hypothetical protein
MIVHNEYLGVQIEWPQNMQDTLYGLSQNEDLWDKLREFIHEMYPGVDTFHVDCVTFICGFESLDEARLLEKDMKKRIIHWIAAYT